MTNITDQLPYEMCDGAIADIEGLLTTETYGTLLVGDFDEWKYEYEGDTGWGLIPWSFIAQTLQYKIDDPGIAFIEDSMTSWFQIIPKDTRYYNNAEVIRLHRYAAILCDDAEAFRVLYQCIKELGG